MIHGYTIYFGNKPYHIISVLDEPLSKLAGSAGTIMANHFDENLIRKTIQDIEAEGTKAVIVYTNHVEEAWSVFQNQFKSITAGGGIVLNDGGETLFIFRMGKWDLPKGKWDEGETIEACALREVKEETGLTNVALLKEVGKTYHTYKEKKKYILKTTVWFLMKAPGDQLLIPQTEEDIESMEWIGKAGWVVPFANTYPAIKDILGMATF
jgi:ADP-ribose pyrophosphatase YjhB (NUDIX family)